jgi:hypothetical protein
MNNREVLVVVTASIILIIGVIALLGNNFFNPQTIASAKITDFSVEWTPFPTVVGVTSISTFNVTVENNGTVELAGLIVTIERIANDNKTNPDDYTYPTSSDYNFSLSLVQSKTIKVYIIANMIRTMEYQNSHQNFLATLSSNGTVLDTCQLFPSAINLQQAPLPTTATKPEVYITDFYLNGYYNPVGVVWIDMFNLTYTNNGTTDVDNITVTFTTNSTFEISREIDVFEPVPNQNNTIRSFVMGEPYSLGNIKANETKEFIGGIWNYLGDSSKVHGFAFTATLKSNETLLDQETVMIPALI